MPQYVYNTYNDNYVFDILYGTTDITFEPQYKECSHPQHKKLSLQSTYKMYDADAMLLPAEHDGKKKKKCPTTNQHQNFKVRVKICL